MTDNTPFQLISTYLWTNGTYLNIKMYGVRLIKKNNIFSSAFNVIDWYVTGYWQNSRRATYSSTMPIQGVHTLNISGSFLYNFHPTVAQYRFRNTSNGLVTNYKSMPNRFS